MARGVAALRVLILSRSGRSAVRGKDDLEEINQGLAGKVIDYTHNNGCDRRIWSSALNELRDLYVYVPPGFDPAQQYPVMLWLNGFLQDEQAFIKNKVALLIDQAIVDGRLPPMIVAAPDGSILGHPSFSEPGSFFLNTDAGNFEDFIIQDVWTFLTMNYPIRPEREAHVIAGVSMGGFGAYNLAFKYPQLFKVVIGVLPPLNLRWVDCHGNYRAKFDPCCWGWRTELNRRREVLARFWCGLVKVRVKRLIDPLYDRRPKALAAISRENPIEMLVRKDVREGLFDMYVAYGRKDQFNVDAQVESFLYVAKQRGITVGVGYDPKGKHNEKTADRLFPGIVNWLGPLLAPYSPSLAFPASPPFCPLFPQNLTIFQK